MQPKIHGLFPIPIYSTDIDRNFTKKELDFVKDQKNYCTNNEGNINTTDNYILNRPELKKIKKFLDECCKDYLKTVICPQNNVEIYITHSWLNYIDENQYFPKDTKSISYSTLRKIRFKISDALPYYVFDDETTSSHLRSIINKIDSALDSKYIR